MSKSLWVFFFCTLLGQWRLNGINFCVGVMKGFMIFSTSVQGKRKDSMIISLKIKGLNQWICMRLHTMVMQILTLSPHSKKVESSTSWVKAFLCRVCTLSPCLSGFPPGSMAFSIVQRNASWINWCPALNVNVYCCLSPYVRQSLMS